MGLFFRGTVVVFGISAFSCAVFTVTGLIGLATGGIGSTWNSLTDLVAAVFAGGLGALLWRDRAYRGEIMQTIELTPRPSYGVTGQRWTAPDNALGMFP